jgi:hypothetical protein
MTPKIRISEPQNVRLRPKTIHIQPFTFWNLECTYQAR